MWLKPVHHQDGNITSEHVHWTELFYDLIHVVAIFLLGNYLSHHLSLEGFLVFSGIFVTLWFAWGELSVYNSIYVSTDAWHRVIMSAMVCTVMLMAAATPKIAESGWTFFAIGFALNRCMLALLYWRANGSQPSGDPLCRTQTRNFFALALIFALSAVLPTPFAYWVFAVGVLVTQGLYAIPKLSVIRLARFAPRFGHISERFALLTLIVLGEGFFKLVVTLADLGIGTVTPDILGNFLMGGVAIFVMCWIYFEFVGHGTPKDMGLPTMLKIWIGHVLLMLCALMVGVALSGQMKVGFWAPFPAEYATLGCLGLAGFIAMIWVLETSIKRRPAHHFVYPWLRIVGISGAFLANILMPHVPTLVGNLVWGLALASQIVVPLCLARQQLVDRN